MEESSGSSEQGVEESHATEEVFGMSVATVELAVAAASLLLSVGMALLVARTLVRPLRRLQASMRRVEQGELDVTSDVSRRTSSGSWR